MKPSTLSKRLLVSGPPCSPQVSNKLLKSLVMVEILSFLPQLKIFQIQLAAQIFYEQIVPLTYSIKLQNVIKIQNGRVVKIEAKYDKFVNHIGMCCNDGTKSIWGNLTSGQNEKVFMVEPDDYIVQVNSRQGAWTDSFQFVTKKGKQSEVFGGGGGGPREPFKAEQGCEIVGLLISLEGSTTFMVRPIDKREHQFHLSHHRRATGIVQRKIGHKMPPQFLMVQGQDLLQQMHQSSLPDGYLYGDGAQFSINHAINPKGPKAINKKCSLGHFLIDVGQVRCLNICRGCFKGCEQQQKSQVNYYCQHCAEVFCQNCLDMVNSGSKLRPRTSDSFKNEMNKVR